MTATVETGPDSLVAVLRLPVWNALADRANSLRRSLPARPDDAAERWAWWQGMNADQQRRAAVLDRLDALCGHIAGRPAPGYAPDSPMPLAALEEADGFTSSYVADTMSRFRAAHAAAATVAASSSAVT
ncbi:hypothetical protein [Streptomyces sp. NPDC051662]|uniref:hypothetical protein n=1 Tax=Streptomyces sp. NPDC051662 TaxID=3154750 RepID=UPI0034211702